MADSPRIEELKRRVQVDPASIAFAALAEEYRRAGRYEEAIATCQAGLQRHPAYLSARVTLGRALLELKRFEEAREELELVLRSAPENLAAIRGLAEIHHRRGDLTRSAKDEDEIASAVAAIAREEATAAEPGPAAEPAPAAEPGPAAEPAPEAPAPPAPRHLELVRPADAAAEEASEAAEDEPAAVEPEPAPLAAAPDPALAALEGLLASILREKANLAARPDLRR